MTKREKTVFLLYGDNIEGISSTGSKVRERVRRTVRRTIGNIVMVDGPYGPLTLAILPVAHIYYLFMYLDKARRHRQLEHRRGARHT